MPIPHPKKNEDKEKFISRFMGNKAMVTEYPDNKQRAAVAYSIWKRKNKKQTSESIFDKYVAMVKE